MATLDDKILDGPNVCYCSDSDEDEKGDLRFCASTPECNVSARMPPSQGGSTGPKGVLADYRNYQRQKLIDQVNAEKEFLKEAKRFTLEEAGNHSSHEDEEEDELATIRLRRLEQLKNYTRGRVVEIANSEQFLQVTDSDSPNLVFVHIYRDGLEAVGVLNEALLEIAARSDSNDTKFYKVKATTLGTSVNFAENALPALQIYDKGNLVGNFVRITDELGEDFNGQSLCKFLEKIGFVGMVYRNHGVMRVDSPLGVILVSKDDSAEWVLFMYPFGPDLPVIEKERDEDCKEAKEEGNISSHGCLYHPNMTQDSKFGVPVKMLAPLLCPKESEGSPFEIKVDNIRFAGFPWHIENSAHNMAVVFVLPGNAESHIVDSFQQLSKKIAIAINSEQQRCNYLRDQIQLMQPAHDEFEALPDDQKHSNSPYPIILEKSGLAQHLMEIFEDVCEYGMVDVFVDDCIEVGFCVEPKALVQAGLTPKSSAEMENLIKHVCPYHGILFLEDTLPSPDSNPSVLKFFEVYEPSRSIDEMSTYSGLPLSQIIQIVKHYLMWTRAIVIYPICNTNVYTTSLCPTSFRTMSNTFAEQFPDSSLAEIVEQFSPPTSLGAFLTDVALYSSINVRMQMIIFLLRNQLLVQLHTFLYLLPVLSINKRDPLPPEQSQSLLSARIRTAVNAHKSEELLTPENKAYLLELCARAIQSGVFEQEVFWLVNTFVSLVPYLNGQHHIEDIMYRMHLDRSTIMRVIDTFAELVQPFYCADSPALLSN